MRTGASSFVSRPSIHCPCTATNSRTMVRSPGLTTRGAPQRSTLRLRPVFHPGVRLAELRRVLGGDHVEEGEVAGGVGHGVLAEPFGHGWQTFRLTVVEESAEAAAVLAGDAGG